jgi:tetratricopeptide (TPR) repeat protein
VLAVLDPAEPPFSVYLAGHGVAGRGLTAADEPPSSDEGPDEQEALQAFARAVHIDPDDPDYHFILGRALLDVRRVREGVSALRRAVALHPDAAEYRLCLGQALWRAGRFEDAAEAFEAVSGINAGDAAARSGAGAARLAAGDVSAALAALDAALRLNPRAADAQSNRGIALWRRGDVDAALTAFSVAARLDPRVASVQRNLGLALLARQRKDDALKVLKAARRLAPGDATIAVDVAETLARLDRKPEAYGLFRQALELSSSCLDERPQARGAFLALETSALRDELGLRRPALGGAGSAAYGALLSVISSVPRLLGAARGLPGAIVGVLLVVGAYPAWNLGRVYVRHHLFEDDLRDVVATPLSTDSDVRDRLRQTARRRGLSAAVDADSCRIVTQPGWRTINCRYAVSVALLPGLRRTLDFEAAAEGFYVALDRLKLE